MDLEGKVLEVGQSVGARAAISLGKHNVALTSQFLPPYGELVRRGLVWSGATDENGVAPGTAAPGTAAALCLYNPAGSGKNLWLCSASLAYLSGTLGAGPLYYCAKLPSAAPTGTSITPVNNLAGNSNAAVGQLFDAATLAEAPSLLRPFCSLTALLASTAVQPYVLKDSLFGEFGVAPGGLFAIEGRCAAGSTPLVILGLSWAELPV